MRNDIYDVIEKNLAGKPTWFSKAACRGAPIEMFFLERGCSKHDSQPARDICSSCPVQPECLEYAVTQPEAHVRGIWGGTTAQERRIMRRQIRAIKTGGLKPGQKISVIDLISTDKT
jgi:WhiB family redox-sensing transcriptional regulator